MAGRSLWKAGRYWPCLSPNVKMWIWGLRFMSIAWIRNTCRQSNAVSLRFDPILNHFSFLGYDYGVILGMLLFFIFSFFVMLIRRYAYSS